MTDPGFQLFTLINATVALKWKPRCVEFCPNGVFEFKDGKAVVAYPVKCGGSCPTVNCSACAPLCHKRAIVFPSRNSAYVQAKGEGKDMIWKSTCEVCRKRYWTNRKSNICSDCNTKKQALLGFVV